MIRQFAKIVVLASSMAAAGASGAIAQDAPPPAPAQRCGGLLCDTGLLTGGRDPGFGPAPDCGIFCRLTGGGPAADAAAAQRAQAAQAEQEAAATAAAEPAKPRHHVRHQHKAKAMPKAPSGAGASDASAPK